MTHELDVVKRLCERVAILDNGKLMEIINVDSNDVSENMNISYSDLAREVLVDA